MEFKKILEFNYSHSYFDNASAPGLFTIIPLAQTQALLADLQMQFKLTANGFFVYVQDSIAIPESCRLSFALYSNNPYLLNFTEMPTITPGDEVFYCDCVAKDSVSLDNNNHYILRQKGLLVNTKEFKVKPVNGKVDAEAVSSSDGSFHLDMTHWPDGLYEVSGGEEIVGNAPLFNGKKVFVSRALIAKPPLAIFVFAIGSSLQQVEMKLASRSVFWRYQIDGDFINGAELSIDVTSVKSKDKFPGTFPSPGITMGSATFLSTEQIPLTQVSWTNIQLIKTKNSKGSTINIPTDCDTKDDDNTPLIANLPNPDITKIYQFKVDLQIAGTEAKKDDYYALIQVKL